jgi:hypothetical protein
VWKQWLEQEWLALEQEWCWLELLQVSWHCLVHSLLSTHWLLLARHLMLLPLLPHCLLLNLSIYFLVLPLFLLFLLLHLLLHVLPLPASCCRCLWLCLLDPEGGGA